jgi:predicted restriction endonuclease
MSGSLERVSWRKNENAVEIGFEHYLDLLEKRIKGDNISLVQELRKFFNRELGIKLRETQARGLMHRSSSVFIEYVKGVTGEDFNPTSQYWVQQGLKKFKEWRKTWLTARRTEAADLQDATVVPPQQTERKSTLMRRTVTVNRVIRDNALSRFLKALYDSHCQICNSTFMIPSGRKYAETHHICPLGDPHNGKDQEGNMIVLCPLHHAMFDYGVIAVHPEKHTLLSIDNNVKGIGEGLSVRKHRINSESLEYHLEVIYGKVFT